MAKKSKSSSTIKALGIMNGTSLDGADFVLTEIDTETLACAYLDTRSFAFPKKLKANLISAAQHLLKVDELALLHHDLGRYYAACFKKLTPAMKKAKVIGLHGQTVFHRGGVATLQIGEPSYLAAASGAVVVSDFRAGDLALGGQGAPIATFFHQQVFGRKNETVSVHNLGGISNLSLIANGQLTLGFDTGPANMLIDMAIKLHSRGKTQFDRDGQLAKKGNPDFKLVSDMLTHPFFKKAPPKSCGREEFGEVFYNKYRTRLEKLSLNDRLATLTRFVALSIAQAYKKHPSEIIFCGGGARNQQLLSEISGLMPDVVIKTSESYGWPSQSIEGAAFALLAVARVSGYYSNLPKSTGAKRFTSLGKITQV